MYLVLDGSEEQEVCAGLAMARMPWLGEGLTTYTVDEGIGDE